MANLGTVCVDINQITDVTIFLTTANVFFIVFIR